MASLGVVLDWVWGAPPDGVGRGLVVVVTGLGVTLGDGGVGYSVLSAMACRAELRSMMALWSV